MRRIKAIVCLHLAGLCELRPCLPSRRIPRVGRHREQYSQRRATSGLSTRGFGTARLELASISCLFSLRDVGKPMTAEKPRAVVLLSGGLDSATTLANRQRGRLRASCPSVRYGQRHWREIEAARRVAQSSESHIMSNWISTSRLRRQCAHFGLPVPKDRSDEAMAQGIPITYVPARNTVFLSLAWPGPRLWEPSTSGLA